MFISIYLGHYSKVLTIQTTCCKLPAMQSADTCTYLSMHPDKLLRVPLGPRRKHNIIQGNTTLLHTCIISIATETI